MIAGLWGSKVGMTQIYSDDTVIPVTVVDAGNWLVTAFKTEERDGYWAVKLGLVKKRYAQEAFLPQWLKKPKRYFAIIREVRLSKPVDGLSVGKPIALDKVFAQGDKIDLRGTTRGMGFAGVMKRYNFSGGSASHGDKTGRKPGSIGNFCAEGRVAKGKKMPGRMGGKRRTLMHLEIVRVEPEHKLILIKGSVPGKSGSRLFMRKRGQ